MAQSQTQSSAWRVLTMKARMGGGQYLTPESAAWAANQNAKMLINKIQVATIIEAGGGSGGTMVYLTGIAGAFWVMDDYATLSAWLQS